MARPKRIPGYLLHKRTGNARVVINGYEHHLGQYGTPESRERCNRLIAEYLAGPSAPPQQALAGRGLTIMAMLAAYLDHAEDYYRRSGELDNIKKALRPLRQLYGATDAASFGPKNLKALRQTMIEDGLTRILINKRVRSIVRVFRWAAGEELIPSHVFQALGTVEGIRKGFTEAREGHKVQPVSDVDIEAVLPHLSLPVAAMVQVQRLAGARPSEVCVMRPTDIDRSGAVWVYTPTQHKTAHLGRDRKIFIGPQAQAVLRRFLLRPAGAYCFSPVEAVENRRRRASENRKTPLKWGNRPGTNRRARPKWQPRDHYDRHSYRVAIRRACLRAGVPIWTPHQLRHSAASEIRKQFGLQAAQVCLGHARCDVTQVYAQADMELAVKVARQLG